jgi:hypothetical protein
MLDFLGIGAQKSGSSWLYVMLNLHEGIRFPAGKEIHFWDLNRARGVEWYRGLFAGDAPEIRKGEITPAYAILPVHVIREIRAFSPAARVLYTIRNPVERAWSSALMELARAEIAFEEASDDWFTGQLLSEGSLQRGDYETCLRNWRGVFPSEQILVLHYDMMGSDPRGFLGRCCRHVGVTESAYAAFPELALTGKVFASPAHPIRPRLREALHRVYDPKIRSLGDYLGEDLSRWLDD